MEWCRREMIPSSSVGAAPGNASSGRHEGWSIWELYSCRNTTVCALVTGNCPKGFPRASYQTISLLLWQVEEPERKYKRQVEHAKLIHSKCTISNKMLLQSTLILEAGKYFQNLLRITTVISLTHDPVTCYKITHAVTQKHSGTSKTKAGQGGLVRLAWFWKSHCATCAPARVILYHVTLLRASSSHLAS